MIIEKNRVVSLAYKLQRNDAAGETIEQVNNEQPFVFLYGVGSLLPDFESNLEGKTIGDKVSFGIAAADAYGLPDDKALEYVPKDIFIIDGKLAEDLLEIDNIVNLRDQQGNLVRARVAEVNEAEVLLDFNHPLAGQDLFFSVEVLEVREATQEEMDHGHVHGPGGHQH
ncbi:MAG TPA: peptidylprolyl isomerase [Bacteroidetes bacterium]|jgi:FKBP-type peptidyl-prolyl cis-trans isomerase SlyD|nr:MAG: peptidylprolyl isomerase [Sphingobacteriales bacterium BACL12 MAG-120802-bin5]KRP13520.1 MAG: peptidylprolyl isomerase [Sphingobacteriales bacterium BACL12 MAG-120813-bin55]HCK22563.1 peptidylprolyl isomerase [Bacteroidota bacterium]